MHIYNPCASESEKFLRFVSRGDNLSVQNPPLRTFDGTPSLYESIRTCISVGTLQGRETIEIHERLAYRSGLEISLPKTHKDDPPVHKDLGGHHQSKKVGLDPISEDQLYRNGPRHI